MFNWKTASNDFPKWFALDYIITLYSCQHILCFFFFFKFCFCQSNECDMLFSLWFLTCFSLINEVEDFCVLTKLSAVRLFQCFCYTSRCSIYLLLYFAFPQTLNKLGSFLIGVLAIRFPLFWNSWSHLLSTFSNWANFYFIFGL